MSFNLGTFSLRRKTTIIETPETQKAQQKEEAKEAMKSRSKATKVHPLMNAVTDQYVDDVTFYQPKINREERYNYWKELLALSKKVKKHGPGLHTSEEKFSFELNQYPRMYVRIFRFISSNYWDQLYFNFFFVFLILCFLLFDRYGRTFIPMIVSWNTDNQLVLLPLLGMFFTQLIPLFGTIFYVHFCYDLVTLLASQDIGNWVSRLFLSYSSLLILFLFLLGFRLGAHRSIHSILPLFRPRPVRSRRHL
jgi:hypothetical protein